MYLQENTVFNLDLGDQGHLKYFLAPSTSCDICTCKVCSCYVHQFRSKRIYKKIQYLTFHLVDKVIQDVAQYPLHHVTYVPAKFKVAMSISLGDAFTRKYII